MHDDMRVKAGPLEPRPVIVLSNVKQMFFAENVTSEGAFRGLQCQPVAAYVHFYALNNALPADIGMMA
ncbi:hypothetical protein [Xanthomonas citri]|uniref:hypothetical protein n=1 Tax=Xanthomonas citri TaxID=346 RepID=UPI0012FDAE21|nr:hypothetical protein [Xanthomonas citri]